MPEISFSNSNIANIYSPAYSAPDLLYFSDEDNTSEKVRSSLDSDDLAKIDYDSYDEGGTKQAQLLVSASSENGHGAVNQEDALKYLKKLQHHAAPGVKFDINYLEDSCYGGTCSAQALNFAEQFINSPILPLKERAISVAKNCQTSSLELRAQQAALNAIARDESVQTDDFSKAKVASILALRDFEIDHAPAHFEEIKAYIAQNKPFFEKDIKKSFVNMIERMPAGLYFCRMLCNADNYKGEYFGHSTIFIKGGNEYFIWDPMGGLYLISREKFADAENGAYQSYKDITDRWLLDAPRYYRIKKKASFEPKSQNGLKI